MPFGEFSRQMAEEQFAKWWKPCRKGVPGIQGEKFNVSFALSAAEPSWTGLPDGQIFAYKLPMGNRRCKALN